MNNDKTNSTVEAQEESQLNKPITIGLLMKYGLPTMISMLVFSTFGLIDGIFASRGIGEDALAAMTAFMPLLTIMPAIGLLFAGGGSAVILRKVGMSLNNEARRNFTSICLLAFGVVLLLPIFATILPTPLLNLLGVNYEIFDLASTYLRIAAWSFPFMVLGHIFNQFLIADGKPNLSMMISVLTSIGGMILNYVAIFVLGFGMAGLAWTTVIATVIPTVVQFLIFANNRKGVLHFSLPEIDMKTLKKIMSVGMAGFLPTAAGAVIVLVMNNVVVHTLEIGALGLAIAGVVIGLNSIFFMPLMGYMQGIGPIISYNYGKADRDRQKKLFKYNLKFMALVPIILLIAGNILADALVGIYALPNLPEFPLHDMAVRGLRIMLLSLTVQGLNTFAGAQFASLSKGTVATALSMSQILLLHLPLLIILPRFLDLTGIWLAMPITQAVMIFACMTLLFGFGKKFGYR